MAFANPGFFVRFVKIFKGAYLFIIGNFVTSSILTASRKAACRYENPPHGKETKTRKCVCVRFLLRHLFVLPFGSDGNTVPLPSCADGICIYARFWLLRDSGTSGVIIVVHIVAVVVHIAIVIDNRRIIRIVTGRTEPPKTFSTVSPYHYGVMPVILLSLCSLPVAVDPRAE